MKNEYIEKQYKIEFIIESQIMRIFVSGPIINGEDADKLDADISDIVKQLKTHFNPPITVIKTEAEISIR